MLGRRFSCQATLTSPTLSLRIQQEKYKDAFLSLKSVFLTESFSLCLVKRR